MKVGVLGAGGFVGQRVVEWLHLGDRAEVVPIVRSHSTAARIARLDVPHVLADARDEEALTRAFAGCDLVFHVVTGELDTIETGPEAMAAAARSAGVRRIVYLSTGMVYGFRPLPTDDDTTPPRTNQPRGYNRSKAVAEERIHELRAKLDVDIVILRPTIVYGPRSNGFTVRPALDLLMRRAFLVDDGSGICNAVHVDNLVSAMWLAGVTPEAGNQTFVVSDRERVTWADFYQSVAEGIGVDFEAIPRVVSRDFPSDYGAGASRFSPRDLIATPSVQALRSRLPASLRWRLKSAHAGWASYRPPGFAQSPAPGPDPWWFILQTCQRQFPITRAERVLGYDPIPFAEGTRRTSEWLRTMGFALGPGH